MDGDRLTAMAATDDERFEQAPFGYLHTTLDWTVVEVNQTLLDLVGLPREAILGRRFPSLLAVGDRIYHDTHLAPLLTLQGRVKEVALELIGSDERRCPVLLNAAIAPDEHGAPRSIRVGIVDVSDRRHYERELLAARQRAEASEARERALQIVIADLAVAVTTEDVERAVAEFLAHTLHTTGGTLWLLGPDGRTLHRRGAIGDDGPTPTVADGTGSAAVPSDGELHRALVARTVASLDDGTVVVPLTSGARPIGLATAARPDATRLTGEERSLLHSLGSQAGQVIERTQLYESRDWMLGMVAHDLRTPLGTIGGLAQTLQRIGRDELPATADDLLGRIVQTSARLTRLTDDLLDASAAATGALRIEPAPVRLGPLLTTTVEDHRMVATEKQIELELENHLGDTVVSIDAGRFGQIIDNLVSNALKYSSAGSRVTITADASAANVHIAVVDRGVGIAPHELPHLFTPFRRTSNEATAGERSTGLGLAIAHNLVTAHDGAIAVESAEGLGTTFTVQLPRVHVPGSH
jgi:PAS domain S-box-containing protein